MECTAAATMERYEKDTPKAAPMSEPHMEAAGGVIFSVRPDPLRPLSPCTRPCGCTHYCTATGTAKCVLGR